MPLESQRIRARIRFHISMRLKPLRIAHIVSPLVALALFALALAVLHRELHTYSYSDIVDSFGRISSRKIILSVCFTLLSYFVLTIYDVLSVRYIKERLAYVKIATASFIGYTISHNLGFSILTGGAARYRLFSNWGLSAVQIAQAIAFSGITFWLGFCVLCGAALIVSPPDWPQVLGKMPLSMRPLGVVFLFSAGGYLLFWAVRRRALKFGDLEFPEPPLRLSLTGIFVSAVDWTLAASVLYALLPPSDVSYLQFLGIFQLSQIAGLLSHVPGGLGVFETVVVLFYSQRVAMPEILGALLAYRLIYYIAPLACSLTLFLSHEILVQHESVRRIFDRIEKRLSAFFPTFFTCGVFVSGVVLLLSGATPAVHSRMYYIERFIPLYMIEASHFLGSFVGIGLVILARGLQRRLDAAYVLSLVFLAAGVVVSLLKGLDYEEAIILTVLLALLLRARPFFYRKAALLSDPLSISWMMSVALVLAGTTWVVLFAHRHIEYSHEFWWQFSLLGDAPRALRATVGAVAAGLIWSVAKLFSPALKKPSPPSELELEQAAIVVRHTPRTHSALALVGDKSLLFNEERSGFIMYAVEGRSWVAMGDPVGPRHEYPDLIWKFRDLCDENDGLCVFYQVTPENLPFYVDVGLDLLKLGEEALVSLSEFSLEGRSRASMRHVRNKFTKEGCEFLVVHDAIENYLPQMKLTSEEWLKTKKAREKGFSLGYFDEAYLRRTPLAIVQRNGFVIAFANVWSGNGKDEVSVDLMRHSDSAPSGVMEFLFVELLLWAKEKGYARFNLGMAPFSGLEGHQLAPLWNRLGAALYQQGEALYNFKGLRQFKEKFDPVWEPRYLAAPGGIHLPRILTNIVTLISGSIRGAIKQ